MRSKKNLVFINSHPIQYFAPLYQEIEKSGLFNLEVWYCSNHGVDGDFDKQFGTNIKWDIPILSGYKFDFLSNSFGKSNIYSFWGLRNFSIIQKLWLTPKSTIIVHGWSYLTSILVFVFGRLFGHVIFLRAESPLSHEPLDRKFKILKRKIRFRFLFSFINKFLYIGKQNKAFYNFYGVNDNDLIFAPYSVNNAYFKDKYKDLFQSKNFLKEKLQIPINKKIILFSGKLIPKKRPMDLLRAFQSIESDNESFLIYMGDGELRTKMEEFINENEIENVKFTGFINQSLISEYYSISDIFVMCSDVGETWGLSSNEAMNFGLPVILSDKTGSCNDLVDGNGYVFQTGNIADLSCKILSILNSLPHEYKIMQSKSIETVNNFSYDALIEGLNRNI